MKILAKKFHKVYHVDGGPAGSSERARLALLQPVKVRKVLGILQRQHDESRGISVKGKDYS